jgi:hypothetical protein
VTFPYMCTMYPDLVHPFILLSPQLFLVYLLIYIYFFAVQGFELRASLGRHCTTRAIPPVLCFFLFFF